MTLTTRLSLFFLSLLALVLAGFSGTLYLVADRYLHRQAEERLEAALQTLVAAVEIGPDGVEWEPNERPPALGPALVWLIRDDQGRVVDQSEAPAGDVFLAYAADRLRVAQAPVLRLDGLEGRWQVGQRWVRPASPTGSRPTASPAANPNEIKYPALSITAGVSLDPVHDTLRKLAGVLTALSLGIWLAAFFAGRGVCRRALLPVRRMAAAARDMDAADLGRRLPAVATRDELEGLSRAFNGLLDRLEESFRRQQRFTGDASHQLRTPLAGLLGQVEVALRRPRSADEYREVLASVQKQASHLGRIVEALLFLARADAEARIPDTEPLALAAWLGQRLHSWSGHPRAADIRLERDTEEPLAVRVQPALLGELVNILLENACKYSPPGSPVTIRLGRDDKRVLLAVEDQGCGIAPEDLPHVGEPFYRAADARRRGVTGVGLGLAIAKRIATAFGGTLLVSSRPGKGSRFTVVLPEAPHPNGEGLAGGHRQ